MRTNHLFSLICLFLLSGSVIGQSFSSSTSFPVSVPDGTAGASTCFGIPTAASATVNVTGLNGVVGNANEITAKFSLNAPANSAGDFVVTLVSPNGISVNMLSRIGGCNNTAGWNGSNVISIQHGGIAFVTDPATAVAGTAYRPSQGITAGSGNTYSTSNNAMTAFQGGPRNGVWTLEVRDLKLNAFTATITSFSLDFNKGISFDPATVPSILCPGAEYEITANSVGPVGSFPTTTDFVIELSDAAGTFATFTELGRVSNVTGINGPITAHIPGATVPGTSYDIRIRALQASPNVVGNVAAVDISGLPSSAITPSASLSLVGGTGPEYEFCQTTAGASAASLDVATCVGCMYNWTSSPASAGGVGASASTFQIGDIATTAAGTVHTVIVTDPASTCKDTTSFAAVIRKDMPGVPTITTSSASVCAGLVDLIATVSPRIVGTYEWFDASGTSVYNPGTSIDTVLQSAPVGVYTVVVTDSNTTCSSAASAATTVNAAATLVLQPFGYHIDPTTPLDSFIFCSNSTYNVNVSGGGPASVYTWSANGSIITTGSSYIPPVSATYTVTTEDANGCPTTISVPMQVRIAPSPAPTVSASGVCGGAVLSASAAPFGNTLNWYVDGTNTGATGQVYTTPTTVSGSYTVRLTAPNTCYAESFPLDVIATPGAATVAPVSGNCLDGVNPVKLVATGLTPGQSYQWYMDAVAMPGETSDTLFAYLAADYTVVVTDGTCESPISNAITVNEAPSTPPITSSSTCQGALLATTFSAGLTYQWYVDGTPVMGATLDTLTAAGPGAYTIEVTNISGCTTGSTDTIRISPAPIAPIVLNASFFCVDATHPVTLYAMGATGSQTYQWYIDGNPTGNGSGTLMVTTAANITVSIVDGLCESATTLAAITYLKAATPTIAVASNCIGTLLSSSVSPGFPGSPQYQWYLDGTAIPGANSQTYITASAGSYTVTVFNTMVLSACESDPSAPHVIIPAPAAPSIIDPSTTLTISTACMGTSGTALFATGATGTQTYKWFYNGSPITTSSSSPYNATATGVYTVKVSDGSCLSAASNSVTVYPAPGQPTITGTTGCVGSTLTSSAAPAGGSYKWYLNGNPVGGNTQSITAAAAGTYTVVISSASPANCSSPASAGKVILGSIGTPTIVATGNNLAGPFSFCSGAGGTLSSGLTGTGFTYTWSVGANVLSYGSTITPTSTGTYILNVANANGCSASISQAVTMAQPPATPTLTVGTANCAGTLLTSSLGSTYKWYQDNGTGTFVQISGAAAQTYTATTPGNYRVTITNVNGCGATSATKTTTDSAGSVTVTIGTSKLTGTTGTTPSFNYCSADRDTLRAIVTGTANTYQWKKNNVNIAGATTAKYVPNTNGAGTYSVVVGASATCTATASQAVTMTTSPAAPTITAQSATAICSGSSVTLTGTAPAGVTTFLWIRNASNYVSVAGNGLATGTYTATSAATTAAGIDVYTLRTEIVGNTTCRSAESAPVSVKRMNPVPSFNNCAGAALGTAATLCKGATLSAISTGTSPLGGTYTYSWYYGTTLKGTSAKYNVAAAGNHRLVLTETIGSVSCQKGSANTNITLAAAGCTPVTCRLASDKDNADELIGESFEAVEMVAYPNPTSDLLNVDILNSGATEGKIVLYNTLGQVVLEKNVTLSEGKVSEQLDLSNMAQGIYSLSFQTANGNKVQKVVKE